MKSVLLAVTFVGALASAQPTLAAAPATDDKTGIAAAVVAMAPVAQTAGGDGQVPTGLPQRAPEPRTLREFWPMFLALAVGWAFLIGYGVMLTRRHGRVASMIHELEADPKHPTTG